MRGTRWLWAFVGVALAGGSAAGVVATEHVGRSTAAVTTYPRMALTQAAPYGEVFRLKGCSTRLVYTAKPNRAFVLVNAGTIAFTLTTSNPEIPILAGVFRPGALIKIKLLPAPRLRVGDIVAHRATCPPGSTGNVVHVTIGPS